MNASFLARLFGVGLTLHLLASTAPAQTTTIFTDNFNSGPSPLWSDSRGDWIASNGVYFAQQPNNNPLTLTALPFTLTDFTVEMDINGVADGGVFLRSDPTGENAILLVTGGNNYGGGSRGGNAGTSMYWHQIVGNVFSSQMNEVNNVFTNPGVENIHLQVRVAGDVYAAYLNGSTNSVTSLTNSTFASGQVELYDYSSQTFDNFVLAVPSQSVQFPVTLGISNAGPSQVVLFWSTNADGLFLESTLSLENSVWNFLTNQPSISGAQFTVPISATNTEQFFRLSLQ
jgi:hypothetical protein